PGTSPRARRTPARACAAALRRSAGPAARAFSEPAAAILRGDRLAEEISLAPGFDLMPPEAGLIPRAVILAGEFGTWAGAVGHHERPVTRLESGLHVIRVVDALVVLFEAVPGVARRMADLEVRLHRAQDAAGTSA